MRDRQATWLLPAVPAAMATALILLAAAVGAILEGNHFELYYRIVQEDGALEWMTFWGFFLAGLLFAVTAYRTQRGTGRTQFLTYLLALFCLVVAMEEISWGQRLLGYQPPPYFLRENFQQELNVHNIFDTDLRKFALKAVILGFGVFLPLAALIPSVGRLLSKRGPVVSPLTLIPAFLATYWLYEEYPWEFTGEIVEMMLGAGFLFAAVATMRPRASSTGRITGRVATSFVAMALLGFAAFGWSTFVGRADPTRSQTAMVELEALANDFKRNGLPISRCGTHKRVFSYYERYGGDKLMSGDFSALKAQGLPDERATYFIDPWNSPIWVRHKCSDSRGQRVLVYSFGPNRRRDSSDWEILGDDVGVIAYEHDR